MDGSKVAASAYPNYPGDPEIAQFMPGDLAIVAAGDLIKHGEAVKVANCFNAVGTLGQSAADIDQEIIFAGVIQSKVPYNRGTTKDILASLQVGGTDTIYNRGTDTVNPGDFVAIKAPPTHIDGESAAFHRSEADGPKNKLHAWIEVVRPHHVGLLSASAVRGTDSSTAKIRAQVSKSLRTAALIGAWMTRNGPIPDNGLQDLAWRFGIIESKSGRYARPADQANRDKFVSDLNEMLIGSNRGPPSGDSLITPEPVYTSGAGKKRSFAQSWMHDLCLQQENLLVDTLSAMIDQNFSLQRRMIGKALTRARPGESFDVLIGGHVLL